MVNTFEETQELEKQKTRDKLGLIDLTAKYTRMEHEQKMERLVKMLEIAKAGGVKMGVE